MLLHLAVILTSAAVKMFSLLIQSRTNFYEFCNFNTICKDNGAMNCSTAQHKKNSPFPSTMTGHTTLVKQI